MPWTIEYSDRAVADLARIFEHLRRSHLDFGFAPQEALAHADRRIADIRAQARTLVSAPFRGARHDELQPGLRHLTIGRAIYWFTPDPGRRCIRLAAIFFGGQDHVRHMRERLAQDDGEAG